CHSSHQSYGHSVFVSRYTCPPLLERHPCTHFGCPFEQSKYSRVTWLDLCQDSHEYFPYYCGLMNFGEID
ncbi:hypothetical protein, partial [Klebsiella pneumoniae]|uniref:hypothetical protein n=1 Tax=Klebsiella pneumoniae TaxID=573 RepID=UPI0019676EC3